MRSIQHSEGTQGCFVITAWLDDVALPITAFATELVAQEASMAWHPAENNTAASLVDVTHLTKCLLGGQVCQKTVYGTKEVGSN
jgi:hypothetical protein